ncbi:Leu/Phe-tRNA-protein transferase [Candidatus Regiella insecticola 5.15]|uniref:Leucyl/phenylalanyl-tRNA--protein transferase n=1 Tax=Candidatus Regiella insecticola 5.15 TaxID=1005043 RepID=G2GXV3_9ENTR|nr:leucyl/phenylalanyl-tRNA--protein transferase [Candidatus Regiella insecticola]EGY29433.1 Leu/Phe-tRNA-protein transferase [Candidatus Regiella insecticola 5.15]
MGITQLAAHSFTFPAPELALKEPNGLLALGGDLRVPRLLAAYRQGIFPWFSPGDPILWWSPDPRAILYPTELHISRSMRRFLRQCPYRFTLNCAFSDVVTACATARKEETWISDEIQQAYCQLHQLGYAHSVEVWQEDIPSAFDAAALLATSPQVGVHSSGRTPWPPSGNFKDCGYKLVGGLYGVAQGALFCGESMFSLADNASKSALMVFCHHFSSHGGELIDCQVLNAHTASLGAREIPRHYFLQQLQQLQLSSVSTECWPVQVLYIPNEFRVTARRPGRPTDERR